jgi:RimJ/RimL family protein N-acetyltransferase
MLEQAFNNIESERIILRRFIDSDLPSFLSYRNDPDVARYQSWETTSLAEAEEFIQVQKGIQPGVPGQWFQFAIALKPTGELIGDCALKVSEHYSQQGEMGYTLAREHQGKGYASEAIRSLLDYAFLDLNLHRVVAITDCENAASVALLERIGLRREGHFIENTWFKGKWGDEYLYAILKDEWLLKRRETGRRDSV